MLQLALNIGNQYKDVKPPAYIPSGGLSRVETIFQSGITIFLILLTILVLFYLIWGAIDWIISGGDKTKLQAARTKIMYALIGLVVAFLAFLIVSMVGGIFGVDLVPTNSVPDCTDSDYC